MALIDKIIDHKESDTIAAFKRFEAKDVEDSVRELRKMLDCAFKYPDDRFIEVVINRTFGETFALSEAHE